MKRALSFALSLLLILMMIPLGTFAAGAETAATSGTTGDCTWTLDGTVLTISGNGKMGDYGYYGTLPWGKNITAVVIEEGVTSIGAWAFNSCYTLSRVAFPASLTAIGVDAFYRCGSLTSVTIPGSVSVLSSNAFYSCNSLTEVIFESGVTAIGSSAFYDCQSLSRLVLPDTLTTIRASAFHNCARLGIVDVPDTLTSIAGRPFACYRNGQYYHASAFALRGNADAPVAEIAKKNEIPFLPRTGLSGTAGNLTWVIDGNGNLTVSGEGEMDDYPTKVVNNRVVSTAPWGTFITSLTVEEGITYIGEGAFYAAAAKSATLPDTLEAIGDGAFWCSDLTAVSLPSAVWYIGDDAFRSCTALTQVHVPDTLLYMGENAFYGCDGLMDENDMVIVGGVLFDYTHTSDPNRRRITVPEGVTVIDKDAFKSHVELISVDLPDSLICIKEGAFAGCEGLFNSDRIMYVDNWLCLSEQNEIASLVVPKGIVGIADHAFESRSKLTRISLPSSLRYIGDFAFAGADHLTEIDLPDGVISIGNAAFFNCVGLKKVTEHASVLAIGEAAFSVWYEGDESYSPLPELTVYTSQGTLTQRYAEAYGIPVVASEHVHNVSDWILLQAPTCTEKGTEVRGCYFCDDLDEYREVLALGHDYDAVVTEPTCTEGGYTTHTCSRCGDSYVDAYTKPNGHAFSDWTQTKAPTCTEKGQESHTCGCGETETRDVDALGHDFSLPAHKDAAGRMDGYDGHTCSRCGELKVDAVLPATGIATDLAGDFDWDNEVTDEDAIWLLMYTFFPEDYPVDQPVDYDGDGEITDEDAIWLLMYTFFPEDYPIV